MGTMRKSFCLPYILRKKVASCNKKEILIYSKKKEEERGLLRSATKKDFSFEKKCDIVSSAI